MQFLLHIVRKHFTNAFLAPRVLAGGKRNLALLFFLEIMTEYAYLFFSSISRDSC